MSQYDTIVVGSGAGGGMAAYALTKRGVRVLLLEAGRNYDPETETPMFNTPEEAPLREEGTPDKPFGYYDATIDGGWQVPGEPYTVAEGSKFMWWRARMLGGRTNHWGRLSFRFGQDDFKGYSRDGIGTDWPFDYKDIEPWYTKTETLIGVYGAAEGIRNSPDSPAGVLHTPPPPRASELLLQKVAAKSTGMPVVPAHVALITRPINGREACFYATPCGRGCAIKANFQSTTVLLPPAAATGKLTVQPNAHVFQVTLRPDGRASGVKYIDKTTGAIHAVTARSVVLAASAGETARILLQSKSVAHPNGLANGSGHVGRNLMDSVGSAVGGQIPALENLGAFNDEGTSLSHVYTPWWLINEQIAGKLNFPRGYHFELGGSRGMTGVGDGRSFAEESGGYGPKLMRDLRRYYGSFIWIAQRGEMLPNKDSYCDLDPKVRDKWGLPVLRFHWKWGEAELKQVEHARRTAMDLIKAAGGRVMGGETIDGAKDISTGGEIIHEVGTVRVGAKPAESALDQYCRAWGVPGLYVMDGSVLASNPDKNPTLTILALSWRASDHLAEELRTGAL